MVKRINISVPDDLFESLEKWKGSFSVSKECQKHLANFIKKKERYAMRSKDLTQKDTLKRLKEEMDDVLGSIEDKYEELGEEKCMEWIKTAHYEEIMFAQTWGQNIIYEWEHGEVLGVRPSLETQEGENLFNYFDEIIKKDPHISWDNLSTRLFTFIQAWIITLDKFWKKLEEEIGTFEDNL